MRRTCAQPRGFILSALLQISLREETSNHDQHCPHRADRSASPEPETFKSDVAALHEMTDNLPEVRDRVVDGAKDAADKGGKKVFEAKNRLDSVKGRVQDSIVQGADRFSGGN